MAITGNKGEWSELYVLLYLLATGKLYAADENLKKNQNMFFPILKVLRDEVVGKLVFDLSQQKDVCLYINGHLHKIVKQSVLAGYAKDILDGINAGADRAFEIENAQNIMDDICCKKIKAPTVDKTDITLQILDVNTGYSPVCGFSIKSKLGSPSTLLNAGVSTNFIYEVNGINDALMKQINAIDTKAKIIDRINKIYENGGLKYVGVADERFAKNLMLVDSMMDSIVGEALIVAYHGQQSDCETNIDLLAKNDPLGYGDGVYYKYKFKKLLCAIALGMTPTKKWDGKDQANGGYIVVATNGDVLAYHIYNRDYFEEYLLKNTIFERASTSRHQYAEIYKENGRYYIKLNLQIRFK